MQSNYQTKPTRTSRWHRNSVCWPFRINNASWPNIERYPLSTVCNPFHLSLSLPSPFSLFLCHSIVLRSHVNVSRVVLPQRGEAQSTDNARIHSSTLASYKWLTSPRLGCNVARIHPIRPTDNCRLIDKKQRPRIRMMYTGPKIVVVHRRDLVTRRPLPLYFTLPLVNGVGIEACDEFIGIGGERRGSRADCWQTGVKGVDGKKEKKVNAPGLVREFIPLHKRHLLPKELMNLKER